nr:hypothetical protein HmN_000342900 [Hymenolepis microstoma]
MASFIINSKSMTPKMPTKVFWKFKKADWPKFTNLLETELNASPINYSQHPDQLCPNITNIIIKCAKKTIPSGKVKHFRVFCFKNLEELQIKREVLRNTAEQTEIKEDVRAWRRQSAVLRQVTLQAKRTTFNSFISNINYQNGGQRTFKFLGNLQNKKKKPRRNQYASTIDCLLPTPK